MKTYIIGLFVVIAIIFTGCNSGQKKDNQNSRDKHEHVDGDGHDHSNEKDHDHSDDDGHDHAKDGNHSEDDGHGHGKESGSIEEIVFSKEQAKLVGLTTEAVSPGTFYQAIKTSGQIQASQGNEVVIAATSNGIVSFTNPSITDGTAINAGQSVVTISAKKLL